MPPRRGVDHTSFTSPLSVEEHGKEKLREVKVAYEEVQFNYGYRRDPFDPPRAFVPKARS